MYEGVEQVYDWLAAGSFKIFLEICGDDSRINLLDKEAMYVFDVANDFAAWIQVWRDVHPWDVKVEGMAVFDMSMPFEQRAVLFPPLVARCLFPMDGLLWSPLFNSDRCIRKLMSVEADTTYGPIGRPAETDEVLQHSAFMTLRLHTYWHTTGRIYSPTIQHLIEGGWYDDKIKVMVMNKVCQHTDVPTGCNTAGGVLSCLPGPLHQEEPRHRPGDDARPGHLPPSWREGG